MSSQMKTRTKVNRLLLGLLAVGTVATLAAPPAGASPSASGGGSGQAGYNAIPSKLSGNVPSTGFEATATDEFGDEVELGGTGRSLQSMSVVLSSWGCEAGTWNGGDCVTSPGATFDVPMTFTVYEDVEGAPGRVLAEKMATFSVQYRPSASNSQCTGGRWYNTKDRTCYNGLPQTVKVSFDGEPLTDSVIWSVAYNTTHSGGSPVGESAACYSEPGGCGYDSLNVGSWSAPKAPYAGSDVSEDEAFVNGVMQTGWTGFRPLGAMVTK
jgi:hypothetical protein